MTLLRDLFQLITDSQWLSAIAATIVIKLLWSQKARIRQQSREQDNIWLSGDGKPYQEKKAGFYRKENIGRKTLTTLGFASKARLGSQSFLTRKIS
ncbi:hypothetical protein COV22_00880 [Candidatus Woesearchaeota archaeon CG10_big_fil_rev_8_21_14_0_10_47_5]|nr:MAG: hypothetical protein COV22_00880 [Candidatus Woesearchaeota archaeon CG10_big_fil_rev_8_21_14_0_10_47_5]